ncbi:hypothetical protein F5I97DRAFT_761701 [Phlebopus sp. FC_14]|nr:hypothetical protein F5I97DRAFT_761701 [Phlebopus sp. FC_14]
MPPLNLPSQQLPSRSPSTRPSHTRSRSSPSVFLSLVVAFGATSFSSSPSSPGSSPGAHLHSPCKARSRLLKRHSTSLEKMQEDEELQSMARQPSSLSLKSKPSSGEHPSCLSRCLSPSVGTCGCTHAAGGWWCVVSALPARCRFSGHAGDVPLCCIGRHLDRSVRDMCVFVIWKIRCKMHISTPIFPMVSS